MKELKLNIEDQYFNAFLNYLKTLDYVSIKNAPLQKKNGRVRQNKKGKTEPVPSQVHEYAEPIKEKTNLQAILKEQNYTGPDNRRFEKFVKELDIQEPIEELLASLTK